MPFLKVFGIQTADEAHAALDCGATALGFLVGLTHRAEDQVTAETARAIIYTLASDAESVLVTHLLDPKEVADLAQYVGARSIQVHGQMPVPDLRFLRLLAPDKRLLKTIHVTGDNAVHQAAAYAQHADALVLDSRTADRLGGTGLPHGWSISRRIVTAVSPRPILLAGGLRPDNVEQAVQGVRPAGVDVNSGVEDSSGRKDTAKMRDFISRARAALLPSD